MRFSGCLRAGGLAFGLAGLAVSGSALANDTAAQLTAGGLEFVLNEHVQMVSEELFISMDEVRVDYVFENHSAVDQRVLVAFPMPDIESDWFGSPVAYPTYDGENIFGFSTSFDGQPVTAQLHQRVFALGVDRTKELVALGVPLGPHLSETSDALDRLAQADQDTLLALGIIGRESWNDHAVHYPRWRLVSAYTWEAVFPAGETVEVSHRYMPSVGGTVGVNVLYDDDGVTLADYRGRYCLEDNIVATLRNAQTDPEEPWTSPYQERWVSYVLTTGANWAGPIERFRLVVDKGSERNLVSFCGEGVNRISPTRFEMVAENFWPGNDIELLFFVRNPDE